MRPRSLERAEVGLLSVSVRAEVSAVRACEGGLVKAGVAARWGREVVGGWGVGANVLFEGGPGPGIVRGVEG